jgi:hypothetical protein
LIYSLPPSGIADAKAHFRSLAESWADSGTSTGLGGFADDELTSAT